MLARTMKRTERNVNTIGRLFCVITVVGGGLLGGCPGAGGAANGTAAADLVTESDHVVGAADAPLTVIEYLDFECPVCGRFFEETYPTIRRDYIDTGRVRWVVRQFPLRQIHPHAQAAAEASECAAVQGAFFAYHDALFAHQDALDSASLGTYAEQAGIDRAAFDACVASGVAQTKVQADLESGVALGFGGTPSFLIGTNRVAGFLSAADFAALLDAELARRKP